MKKRKKKAAAATQAQIVAPNHAHTQQHIFALKKHLLLSTKQDSLSVLAFAVTVNVFIDKWTGEFSIIARTGWLYHTHRYLNHTLICVSVLWMCSIVMHIYVCFGFVYHSRYMYSDWQWANERTIYELRWTLNVC